MSLCLFRGFIYTIIILNGNPNARENDISKMFAVYEKKGVRAGLGSLPNAGTGEEERVFCF